jgi:hypothetical protein
VKIREATAESGAWLVLLFSLPSAQASGRVDVWRRLKRSGALPLASGGHVLPDSAENRERFEWLAEAVRQYAGEASVLSVSAIHGLPRATLKGRFIAARRTDYARILEEAGSLKRAGHRAKRAGVVRLRKHLQEIADIDYFGGAMQQRAEAAVQQLAGNVRARPVKARKAPAAKGFKRRVWLTRPRPGIDRVASAWLIRNFIDPEASFRFANDPAAVPRAIPFDMYQAAGFGHRGGHCTFETLLQDFKLQGKALRLLAEMIHDADLKDERFGHGEAITVDRILKGWAATGMADEALLHKGAELIDGLYRSIA